MPLLLEPIDRIARRLQRDVLMLAFCNCGPNVSILESTRDRGWERNRKRREILAWLDAHTIAHAPCLPFWVSGLIHYPYQGHVFVDVPYDPGDKVYRQLTAYLEDGHGRCVHKGVGYHVVALAVAMRNARHDTKEYQDDLLGD